MSIVSILGAGPVGAAVAHRLAQRARVSAVVLIDPAADAAAGKALDIRQSGPVERVDTKVSAARHVLDAAGASAIVIADTAADGREWSAEQGLELVAQLLRAGTTAPFVFAGPSHGGLLERCARDLDVPSDRLIGTAASAIVGTARALTAVEMNVSAIELAVVGRPPAFVVGWAAASTNGIFVTERVPAHRLQAIAQSLPRFWPPGPYAIASATAGVVEALTAGSRRLHPALTVLDGSHGTRGVAALLPLELGRQRILASHMPSLSPMERTAFVNSLG